MTRAERLKRLKELDKWKEGDNVLGIPKTRVIKLALKKKKKVKKEDEADDKKKKKVVVSTYQLTGPSISGWPFSFSERTSI